MSESFILSVPVCFDSVGLFKFIWAYFHCHIRMSYPNVIMLMPSYGITQMTRLQGASFLAQLVLISAGLNVAPEGLAQDAAWWLYLLFACSQEVPEPPQGTSLSGLTDLNGGGESWRPVLWVFCLGRRHIERQLMAPTGWSLCLVQVFAVPAAQLRWDSSHCSMTSFALSIYSPHGLLWRCLSCQTVVAGPSSANVKHWSWKLLCTTAGGPDLFEQHSSVAQTSDCLCQKQYLHYKIWEFQLYFINVHILLIKRSIA